MMTCSRYLVIPCLLGAAACDVGGPGIQPIADRMVAVGDEVTVEINALLPDSGEVRYSFDTNAPNLQGAQLVKRPDGSALFRWRPTAQYIGEWVFDFTAQSASGDTTESITIDVRSAMGSNTLPLFRHPVGAGTAIDLLRDGCIDVAIETTDQDSTSVHFAQEEPIIEGATLEQTGEMTATWHWCPTADQQRAKDRYLLTVSADDGENPRAIKRYQLILRSRQKDSCAGELPAIAHAPADQTTVNELEIRADVSDAEGLKAAPLFYYSTTQPSNPPDLRAMTQINMSLDQGDNRGGTWLAKLPNPVATAAPGSEQSIWYAIVAEDNDDLTGDCDHVQLQLFEMKVTTPGGDGGSDFCSSCTADNQCGGEADNCLRVGVEGEAFCMQGCSTDADCPSGSVCSQAELTSIEGAMGRQCVPTEQRCAATESGSACANDSFENNDTFAAAQPLEIGSSPELMLCPVGTYGSEDDWYRIDVPEDSTVTVQLNGAAVPDMDLDLMDSTGTTFIGLTYAEGSTDSISECLPAGTYYVRAFSFFAGQNEYTLSVTTTPSVCEDPWWEACWDDYGEDDDSGATSRAINLNDPFNEIANQICSGDDDWFNFYAFAGETVYATLTFSADGPGKDLDFQIYNQDSELLVGCTEETSSACTANGQSAGSNEQLSFQAPQDGLYYLVVRGWSGAENQYDLCASLTAADCPTP